MIRDGSTRRDPFGRLLPIAVLLVLAAAAALEVHGAGQLYVPVAPWNLDDSPEGAWTAPDTE